jgi:hypothetical protein
MLFILPTVASHCACYWLGWGVSLFALVLSKKSQG